MICKRLCKRIKQDVISEKLLVNHISDKHFYLKYINLKASQINKPKESIQWAYEDMKRYSASLATRDLQIKITMRNHYTLTVTTERKIRKKGGNKCDNTKWREGYEKPDFSYNSRTLLGGI